MVALDAHFFPNSLMIILYISLLKYGCVLLLDSTKSPDIVVIFFLPFR